MKPSSRGNKRPVIAGQSAIARMRPFLGTFVEIRAEEAVLIEAGFSAVAEVHRLMSFFDPASELSVLNRAPMGQWIALDPRVIDVLSSARELEELSGGAFNAAEASGEKNAFEIRGTRARRIADARLDLGGIAKGYAVDRAVRAILELRPDASGIVNAGGDLRVFGEAEQLIHLRAETPAGPLLYEMSLQDGAIATSSREEFGKGTFSVLAGECLWADALTKVAAAAARYPELAPALHRCLGHFGARMLSFDGEGRPVEAA